MTMITNHEYVNETKPQYPLKSSASVKKHTLTSYQMNRMWKKALRQMRKNTLKRAQNKISEAQKKLKRVQNTHRAAKREWKKQFRIFQKTQKKCSNSTSTYISTSDELHTKLLTAKSALKTIIYAVKKAEKELTQAQISKECLLWAQYRSSNIS